MRHLTTAHPAPEGRLEASGPGSVVAEIGRDHGAVVVHVPPGWQGREVEIRHLSQPWSGVHVAVLARRLQRGTDYSAFFPSLLRGEYQVRPRPATGTPERSMEVCEVRSVGVAGGQVTHLHLGVPEPSPKSVSNHHDACSRSVAGNQ